MYDLPTGVRRCWVSMQHIRRSCASSTRIQTCLFDLILLDIKMPVLNGFELCKEIREIDKRVHIIFITASEAYYEKFRGQHFPELGKINYIQNPIGNDELVQIVNTIIGNSIAAD
jgi:two-component SAPR family response regulator